jgi:predicted transcriptional regulator
MQKMIPALTKRQRYWLEHIQACEASGKSMAEYATEHGVKVRAMYSGRKMLVNKGVLSSEQQNRFQRVQVMEAAVNKQWRIGLPNGVSVAFAGEVDARTLTTVLSSAASLE